MKACDYCNFIFFLILNVFTIASLCTFSKDYFNRFSILFHIIFFSTAIISYYLLLTIRKDPGIVKRDSDANTANYSSTIDSIVSINSNEESKINCSKELEDILINYCNICLVNIVKLLFLI